MFLHHLTGQALKRHNCGREDKLVNREVAVMSKRRLLALSIPLLLVVLAIGCGGPKSRVAGRYLFGPNPQYYIDFRSNGEFSFGCSTNETRTWPQDWPIGISMVFPQAGNWYLKGESQIMFRAHGSETPFGKLEGDEIIDILRSVWRKD